MVERMKRAVKPFYNYVCNVYEKEVTEGEFTRFEKVLKYSRVPCRLSAKNYLFGESAGKNSDSLLDISKRVKVFVPPEYEIKPGSLIEIEHAGKTKIYGKSGEMNLYESHSEFMVEIGKDYA